MKAFLIKALLMKVFLFTFDKSIIKHYDNNLIIDNNHNYNQLIVFQFLIINISNLTLRVNLSKPKIFSPFASRIQCPTEQEQEKLNSSIFSSPFLFPPLFSSLLLFLPFLQPNTALMFSYVIDVIEVIEEDGANSEQRYETNSLLQLI